MDRTFVQPDARRSETAVEECCGGAHKHVKQEEKKQTGCGCGPKQEREARKSSCCG